MSLGKIADTYELIREIGGTPRAKTYVARGPDGLVAIKSLRFESAADHRAVDFFEREITTLSELDHPGVARFVDPLRVDDDYYRIYEYVSGQSLAELIEKVPVPAVAVSRCAQQVLEALNCLHSQQPPILHRDIQPATIIRQTDGSHLLVAFGGLKAVEDHFGGAESGTANGYVAPEQIDGAPTPQSDLYALGATLAHLATRRHPLEMPNSDGKLQWRSGPDLPEPLDTLIDALLEPVARNRPESAAAALKILMPPTETLPAVVPVAQPPVVSDRPVGKCPKRVAKRFRTENDGSLHVFMGGTPGTFERTLAGGLVGVGVIVGIAGGGLLAPLIGAAFGATIYFALGHGGTEKETLELQPDGSFVRTYDRGEYGIGRETGTVSRIDSTESLVLETDDGDEINIGGWLDAVEVPWVAWILHRYLETGRLPGFQIEE